MWLLTFWALCLSTSSRSSSLPATVERECWVTEVWSSPGLTPDLLSLLPLFPQSSPPSPLTSTCFPLFLLARSLMSDIVRVCVSMWTFFPTACSVELLVYFFFSQSVISFSNFFLALYTPTFLGTQMLEHFFPFKPDRLCFLIKPLCRTDPRSASAVSAPQHICSDSFFSGSPF